MRGWLPDVMKIAAGFWIAGVLTIALTLVFFDSIFPAVQWVARQLL